MKWITTEYIKKEAVKDNILQWILYTIASPLSILFVKLNISANKVTVGSIWFAVLAFLALIFDEGSMWFCIFWAISLYLDFCDGTVARISESTNKTAFRFDHTSDIFKISLVFFGAGIHYNEFIVWILSTSGMFLFLFAMLLNDQLGFYNKVTKQESIQKTNNTNKTLKSKLKDITIIRHIYSILFTLNGHSLLYFFIIPFGVLQFKLFILYFIGLTSAMVIKIIPKLLALPKLNMDTAK